MYQAGWPKTLLRDSVGIATYDGFLLWLITFQSGWLQCGKMWCNGLLLVILIDPEYAGYMLINYIFFKWWKKSQKTENCCHDLSSEFKEDIFIIENQTRVAASCESYWQTMVNLTTACPCKLPGMLTSLDHAPWLHPVHPTQLGDV